MRIHRDTMLAGIAALALFAGAGVASAQDTQNQNKGPQAGPAAQQPAGKMGQSERAQGQQGKMGQSAQPQNQQGQAGKTAQGQKMQPGNHAAQARTSGETRMGRAQAHHATGRNDAMGANHHNMAAERHRARTSTAQGPSNGARQYGQRQQPNGAQQQFGERQRNGFEGLQGNAAGGNVQLSDEQRMQIRNTVLNGPRVPRAGNVTFPVVAGTVVPRGSIDIVPLPPTLVRIEPAWRHYRYFVWNDQLVIVNPRDMRIVAVVYV